MSVSHTMMAMTIAKPDDGQLILYFVFLLFIYCQVSYALLLLFSNKIRAAI